MTDNFRSAPSQPQTRTAPTPAQVKKAPAPVASSPPQTAAASPTAGATPENLTIVPRLAGAGGAVEIDWEPAVLGTNKSYGCVATVPAGESISVTVVQALYRRTFDGNGVARVSPIPPAAAGTEGTLTARDGVTGASVTYTWRWEPKSQSAGSTPAATKRGLLGRLFGGAAPAAAQRAKTRTAKKAATVAQRLGSRAHLACRAKFFGLHTEGQRFAFIVDQSGSMEGTRWAACVGQLQQALWGLSETAQFTVVFFNETAHPDAPTWQSVNVDTLEAAINQVKLHRPGGGTFPAPAFEAVFKMAEPPDVVFFLTDGELGEFNVDHVAQLKGSTPTVVNTIALENATAAEGLSDIAADSGGQYVFISSAAEVAV